MPENKTMLVNAVLENLPGKKLVWFEMLAVLGSMSQPADHGAQGEPRPVGGRKGHGLSLP